MVKYVLWFYVLIFTAITLIDIIFGGDSSFKNPHWNINLFWVAIVALAICESIENSRK